LEEGEEAGDVAENEEAVAETERLQFVEFAPGHRSEHQGGQHVGYSLPLAADVGHLRVTVVVGHLQANTRWFEERLSRKQVFTLTTAS